MKPAIRSPVARLALILACILTPSLAAAQLVDDRTITVRSAADVRAKRRALIAYLWGKDGFPKRRLPDLVLTGVRSPVQHLAELDRVDELRMNLAPGLEGLAYHFVAQRPNRQLVVVHHGHACSLDDDPSPADVGYGLQRQAWITLRRCATMRDVCRVCSGEWAAARSASTSTSRRPAT